MTEMTRHISISGGVTRWARPHVFLLSISGTLASLSAQEPTPIRLYIDADYTIAKSSAISIERGVRTALSEVDDQFAGRPIELVRKDHRGSLPRSKRHLDQYLKDEQALAVVSGLHSPPLLAHRDFIKNQEILVLDPWAAAGPITRFPSTENWIFRLAVDDTKAGQVIVDHALGRCSETSLRPAPTLFYSSPTPQKHRP
jgi:branched-chain amino acid transport system substrate-binding protein